MGYSHYYVQNRSLTAAEWHNFTTTFRHMLNHLPACSHSGGYYADYPLTIHGGDGTGQAEVNGRYLEFNGDAAHNDNLAHESYYIERHGRGYHFCKTARKPYDLLVCAVLLVLCEVAPAAFDIRSDGNMRGEEWQPARDFLRSLPPPLPKRELICFGEPMGGLETAVASPLMEVIR
jgi:hypothetical protein